MQKKKTVSEEASSPTDWQKGFKAAEKKELYKKITIWATIGAACFLGLAGLVYLAEKTGTNNTAPVENANLPTPRETDIVLGNPDAKVIITEYADFQCPACASYNPLTNQILNEYEGKVKIVYRHFPLRGIHKNAQISGQAAYAAWKMGKFSEMKDLLYQNQASWEALGDPREVFVEYAKDLELKSDEFTNLMNSDEAKNTVLAGEKEALGLGLNSTPSFFIGSKYFAPQGYETFKQLIEEQLN